MEVLLFLTCWGIRDWPWRIIAGPIILIIGVAGKECQSKSAVYELA